MGFQARPYFSNPIVGRTELPLETGGSQIDENKDHYCTDHQYLFLLSPDGGTQLPLGVITCQKYCKKQKLKGHGQPCGSRRAVEEKQAQKAQGSHGQQDMIVLSTKKKESSSQGNRRHQELSCHVLVAKGRCRRHDLGNPFDLEEILADTQDGNECPRQQESPQQLPDIPVVPDDIYS